MVDEVYIISVGMKIRRGKHMDVFVEQIAKKKSETVDKLKIAGIIVLVFVLSFVCVFILPGLHQIFFSLSFALVAGVVYGAWVLITGMNLEFEYAVTNGDVTCG